MEIKVAVRIKSAQIRKVLRRIPGSCSKCYVSAARDYQSGLEMMVFMRGKYCFSVQNQTACMRTEITMLHSTERSCIEYLELLLSNV